jgi:hypothetical protein
VSEPENFLSRWARLKREAAEAPEAAEKSDTAATEAPADDLSEPARDVDASSAPSSAPTPAFDLSTLPPIESITATTDIRAFLAPGVPPELTRAALRRAWVADPSIRDFVGIAENQWDFNDPHGVPGFGPLGPLDDVRRLLAQAIGEAPGPPEQSVTVVGEKSSAPRAAESNSVAIAETKGNPSDAELSSVDAGSHSPEPLRAVEVQSSEIASAAQNKEVSQDQDSAPSVRRGHGSALPR